MWLARRRQPSCSHLEGYHQQWCCKWELWVLERPSPGSSRWKAFAVVYAAGVFAKPELLQYTWHPVMFHLLRNYSVLPCLPKGLKAWYYIGFYSLFFFPLGDALALVGQTLVTWVTAFISPKIPIIFQGRGTQITGEEGFWRFSIETSGFVYFFNSPKYTV